MDAALADPPALADPARPSLRAWKPRRVLATRAGLAWPHGRAMVERAAALGAEVIELPGDRLALDFGADPRRAYAEAKATLAVVTASPSRRRLQPIAPSADWRIDLAEGCPAHCAYCYLAGSLKGPPIVRAYANLDEILAEAPPKLGEGTITSRSAARAHEGTTFEASCYTDPLGIEHVTGSLAATIAWFGAWDAPAQLRFTTKFSAVDPLLDLAHHGRTRMRVSINAPQLMRFEGGAHALHTRLDALARMARAGYPVGLTIAPIMPSGDWRAGYGALIADAAAALGEVPGLDLTVELITHRFTPGSKAVLEGWYPGSELEMDEAARSEKRNKFGGVKHVYPRDTMRDMRAFFERELARELPQARILYWT